MKIELFETGCLEIMQILAASDIFMQRIWHEKDHNCIGIKVGGGFVESVKLMLTGHVVVRFKN